MTYLAFAESEYSLLFVIDVSACGNQSSLVSVQFCCIACPAGRPDKVSVFAVTQLQLTRSHFVASSCYVCFLFYYWLGHSRC